ncbi:hypothetical protein B7755_052270 [Streptomyces sp. NBS 14/10]|nr:hypothetical protein [Streptomyces sp. NBS 14/10]KAK1176669.1 hypothetical protein B7755_052270 [Streptomyces sp. NBS 14/10]
MRQDLLDLGGRVSRVDADHHTADTLHGQSGEGPFGACAAHHRDAIAVLHTVVDKAERDLAYPISVRPPYDPVHDPFAPVARRNDVGLGARTIKQQLRMRPDRFKIHQIHHTASPRIHQS